MKARPLRLGMVRHVACGSTTIGFATLAFAVSSGCIGPPAVEVSTRIGSDDVFADGTSDDAATGSTSPSSRDASGQSGPRSAATTAAKFVPQPPADDDAFAALVAAVRTADWETIAVAAHNIAQADAAVWPRVRAALLAPRRASKSDYRTVLSTIGGDVPNRYGHFDLAWKKAHGFRVTLSDNWFDDLLALPSDKISKVMRPVYRDCVLQAALLRAASHAAAQQPHLAADVVDALLDTAYVHHGTFRDEVGRALMAVGSPAVPHLVRSSAEREHEDEPTRRRAQYALFNLDRMDQREPRRALTQARPNLAAYVELIDAHGLALLAEAAQPLLELVDDPVPRVRAHARAAFLAYVRGSPGSTEKQTLRLLGGGTTTRVMLAAHRRVAAAAIAEALAGVSADDVEPPCSTYLPSGVRDRACTEQPHRHTLSYFAWLDGRRRDRDEAALAAALASDDPRAAAASLDHLLAQGVVPPNPPAVVRVFVALARTAAASGDALVSAQLLRKSALLLARHDPDASTRLRAEALRFEATASTSTGVASGRHRLHNGSGSGTDTPAEPQRFDAQVAGHRPDGGFAVVFAALVAILGGLTGLGHMRAAKRVL